MCGYCATGSLCGCKCTEINYCEACDHDLRTEDLDYAEEGEQ